MEPVWKKFEADIGRDLIDAALQVQQVASPSGPPAPAKASMRWLERLEEGLIAFLMAAMTLITFLQVVARYVFNYSFVWALELSSVLFAWLIFIGMSYGVRVGAHIGIDAVVRQLGPRAARASAWSATALCVVYALIVLAGGWRYVQKMMRSASRCRTCRSRNGFRAASSRSASPCSPALRPGVRAPLAWRGDALPRRRSGGGAA